MKRVFSCLSPLEWVVVTATIGLVALHFLLLQVTPPGFFVDEALTGAHVTSMLSHGTDANGVAWPLFASSVGGGYTTPVYLYPLVGWARIFGASEYELRAFSMFVTVIAIFILGASMRMWTKDRRLVYTVWIAGLTLPWAWLGGSLAWDPAMLPLFIALAWFGFSGLIHKNSHRTLWLLLTGTTLLLGAYAYPPFRVSGPLLLIGGAYYAFRQQRITLKHLAIVGSILVLLALPLLKFLLEPDAMSRTQSLSVFASSGPIGGCAQIIYNYILLLNPISLFIIGDPNLRHSTHLFGMLGGVGLIGIAGLLTLWRRPRQQLNVLRRPLFFASLGIIIALLGSALTNEGQPHYLRATAAWPFFVILIAIGWQRILLARCEYVIAAISICVVLTAAYATDLAVDYPARSANAFDSDIRHDIQSNMPADYPNSAKEYYKAVWR